MAWLATGAMAAIIAVMTLKAPGSGGPPFPLNDKLAHFLAFAALALPLSARMPRRAWRVAVGAILYGAAIEVIQPHVGRSGEWADLLADALGAATGATLAVAWRRWRART